MENKVICDYCQRSFTKKRNLKRHIHFQHNQSNTTCSYCNVTFKSIKLLTKHHKANHDVVKRYACCACGVDFASLKHLKYHIREFHFNLLTKVPYCHLKKVNQVWFEKVDNSKNIVEIRKAAENVLLLRKLDANTSIKVGEQPTKVLDLRNMYPTNRSKSEKCDICCRLYEKVYLKKHKAVVHNVHD